MAKHIACANISVVSTDSSQPQKQAAHNSHGDRSEIDLDVQGVVGIHFVTLSGFISCHVVQLPMGGPLHSSRSTYQGKEFA